MTMMNKASADTEPAVKLDRGWKSFQIIGGVAAFVAAILFRRWLSAEFSMLTSAGVFHLPINTNPSSPLDWFYLLQANKFVGLLMLNAFDLVNYALVGLIFTGVYSVLRRSNKAWMAFAMTLTIMGIAVYFTSNQAFVMLSLSNQFSAAADSAQRSWLLAAGQLSLNANDAGVFGTGVFWGFIFVNLAGLVISIVMLQSRIFSKATAYIGILANAFGLGHFFALAFAPALTFIPLSASAPFLLVWYILVGARLLRSQEAYHDHTPRVPPSNGMRVGPFLLAMLI